MQQQIQELETQLGQVNLDLANLAADKARNASMWVAERIPTDLGARLTLETKIAEANARKAEITFKLQEAKAQWRAGRRTDVYSALIKVLQDNNLGHLIDQANELADASRAVGMWPGHAAPYGVQA